MGELNNHPSVQFYSNGSDRAIPLEQWYASIAIAGLLTILLYTLFPYDFSLISDFSLRPITRNQNIDGFNGFKDYLELFLHLALFGLFSFGFAGVLQKQRLNKISGLCLMLLTCAGLGLTTELLQAILPGRHTNLLDVFSASVGGLVGWGLFYQWRWPILNCGFALGQKLKSYLAPQTLAIGFVGYFLLTTVAMVFLPITSDLRNWDDSYPLILGNELGGGRAWQGTITQVQFFDRALPPAAIAQLFANNALPVTPEFSLLAAYDFTQASQPYTDQAGNLPNLSWHEQPLHALDKTGVSLNSTQWLLTTTPATYLNQKIRQNHALTLNLIIQPANLTQSGPARIVSLSKDSRHRNLTVGQAGNNLVVRLRTPSTGKNGSNPPLIVPQVFKDTIPLHLVVTYTDAQLQVYVNGPQNLQTFRLPHWGYKLLYYGWIFIPLGSFIGLLLALSGSRNRKWKLLALSSVMISPLLLEGVLLAANQRSFVLENVLISLGLMMIALLLTWKFAHQGLRFDQIKS